MSCVAHTQGEWAGKCEIQNRAPENWAENWAVYDYAYRRASCHGVQQPITLERLKNGHGSKAASRRWMSLPKSICDWNQQKLTFT